MALTQAVEITDDPEVRFAVLLHDVGKGETPQDIAEFDPDADRILGPILLGGPAELARCWSVAEREEGYVSACHMCYLVRKNLVGCAPESLGPKQVYGL